jgi:SAM-dependent methyltransferase
MSSYGYFDEAYFQTGAQKGTAYSNYKEGARDSPTFREIAAAIIEVFQPRRVLDVGCATGTIVRHLNNSGCEAHGIDVSEWAVRNAEHPNVKLAPADKLPYPNKFFDLVISCHALEHLPDAVVDPSIKEIKRVSSGFVFNMLPMIGTAPYTGNPEEVRSQLRKDPTHQQLQSIDWWIQRFECHGFVQVPMSILFANDTSNVELSTGQFVLKSAATLNDAEQQLRSSYRNQLTFRSLLVRQKRQNTLSTSNSAGSLTYTGRIWKDVERTVDHPDGLNLSGKLLCLVVIIEGSACNLRFAAGRDTSSQPYADVGEIHFSAKPGCNVFTFSCDQMNTLRGTPDYSRVNHLAVGGENQASTISVYCWDEFGNSLLP